MSEEIVFKDSYGLTDEEKQACLLLHDHYQRIRPQTIIRPSLRSYFDKDGDPMPLALLSFLLGKEYKIVKQEHVGKYFISTVWLGIDHGFHFPFPVEHVPVIFETMVFCDDDEGDDIDMERYCTQEQALEGHRKMVRKYKCQNHQRTIK